VSLLNFIQKRKKEYILVGYAKTQSKQPNHKHLSRQKLYQKNLIK